MRFRRTNLQGAWLIELEPLVDDRGMFARTMCTREFAAHGLATEYVQQNVSVSARRGTIRGMHLRRHPHGEEKLIRCTRGAIFDVIIDLRRDSQSCLSHESIELSASNRLQLYVPKGFAHGFQALVDDVEVEYLMSSAFVPEAELGIRYDDPRLAIPWPLPVSAISEKDATWPLLDHGNTDPRFQ
jgi:dTDP-4-dehydrorhamnose 3,5-epimerase